MSISRHFDNLLFRFEEAFPVFRAGVAEMLILSDDHITVTDLPQRTQAEICDFCVGDSKAEGTSVGAETRHGVSLYTKQQFIVKIL